MKKSKRAFKKTRKRITSFLCISAVLILLTVLWVLHMGFPIKYNDIIISASKRYEIDDKLIRAVIWTESKYKKDAVSSRGAIGLMQLLPSTAEYMAANVGYDDFDEKMLFDERVNIELGSYYLKYLFGKFGDEKIVLAAYNAGEGNVLNWMEKDLEKIPFKETRDYVKKVSMIKKIYYFKSK